MKDESGKFRMKNFDTQNVPETLKKIEFHF